MPCGLLDYDIYFFAYNRRQKLGMEGHYASWLETMLARVQPVWT